MKYILEKGEKLIPEGTRLRLVMPDYDAPIPAAPKAKPGCQVVWHTGLRAYFQEPIVPVKPCCALCELGVPKKRDQQA